MVTDKMKQLSPILKQAIVGVDPCLTAAHAHVASSWSRLPCMELACLLCMNVNVAFHQSHTTFTEM